MTREEAINVLENEKKCVLRDSCERSECASCDLVMPIERILYAYDIAIAALREQEEREKRYNSEKRIKLDINNLFRQIEDVISNSRSKIARENGFGIAIGLDLLSKYLMEIGELAIKQDNKELIEILVDLHVLRREEDTV